MRFTVGATVVLREVIGARIRSARPLRVIEDSVERFVGYLVPRSTVAWPRLADGIEQSQTPDQGWRLPLERWRGPGSLFIVPAGAGFATVLFCDAATGQPLGWKVDFFRPLRRGPVGFDTLDHAFDLLVGLDGSWQTKDLDDLAQLRRLGLLTGPEHEAFRRDSERVERWLADGDGPFTDPAWRSWRPDPRWAPLELPDGWRDVGAAAATDGLDVTGSGWRSAQGIRLLDGDGAVHLDVDLADGALWHGHAAPTVVEALRRQVALGWRLGPDHPAVTVLGRQVLDTAPAGWVLRWLDPARALAPMPAVAELDDALRRCGWPFDLGAAVRAGCAEAGRFGPALFGGVGAAALWLGPGDTAAALDAHRRGVDDRTAHIDAPAAHPDAHHPDALAAVAALETLRLGTADVTAATTERAGRIRAACGLRGDGPYLVVPPGTAADGVVLPTHGRGLLATVAGDEDEAELVSRLGRRCER